MPIDPTSPFLNAQADTRRRFGHVIDVHVEAPDPLWPLHADANEVERAIRTIAFYAVAAMPFGGAMTFRASNADVRLDDPRVYAFVKEGCYVRFDVVCRRALGVAERLDQVEPRRATRLRDGADLAHVFGEIKRNGGYLWIGTDTATAETALTVLWPTATA
jgi:hypothetical protein